MILSTNITGIILAGGENRRMGQNKALIVWKGKRLIDWVFEAFLPLCNEIIISSNQEISVPGASSFVSDNYKNIGPIADIEAGLKKSSNEINLIASCDTPMLSTDFFRYMLEKSSGFEVSLPVHGGINEPMIGVYMRSVLPHIQESISSGLYKPPAIIKSRKYQEISINEDLNFYTPNLFLNLNTPDDLKSN